MQAGPRTHSARPLKPVIFRSRALSGRTCGNGDTMLEVLFALVPRIPELLLVYWFLAAGSVLVTVLPVPVPEAFKWVTPGLPAARSRRTTTD